MSNTFNFPSLNNRPSETTLWDVFSTALNNNHDLSVNQIAEFFSEAAAYLDNFDTRDWDFDVCNEAPVYFCDKFFSLYHNDSDLLLQLAKRPETNKLIYIAYESAVENLHDDEFEEKMIRLADAYGFVLPSQEEIVLDRTEFLQHPAMPSMETVQIISDIRKYLLGKAACITIASVRQEDYTQNHQMRSLQIHPGDYMLDASAVEGKINCAVVYALRQTGTLLVCNYNEPKSQASVAGFSSENGKISAIPADNLHDYCKTYLPNIHANSLNCFDSISAIA